MKFLDGTMAATRAYVGRIVSWVGVTQEIPIPEILGHAQAKQNVVKIGNALEAALSLNREAYEYF